MIFLRLILSSLLISIFVQSSYTQEVWSLRRCIEYAREHSLNIKQADNSVELARVSLRQNRHERLPSLNGSFTGGVQYGRTIDPTTNSFDNQSISFNSYGLSARATLFNGGAINNSIQQSQLELQAAMHDTDYAFNVTAIGIANAYLQILMAGEQLDNARKRLDLSQQQLNQVDKLIAAGVVPQNDRLDILAQVARDQQTIVQTENLVELHYLTLKSQMFLDLSTQIKVEAPPVLIPADADPESLSFLELYSQALTTQPQIKADEYRLQSAITGEKVARSTLFPNLSVFAGLDTRWSSVSKKITGFEDGIQEQTIFIDNTPVSVGFPVTLPVFEDNPYFDQLDQNFGQNVGVALSIPIYNNHRSRANLERAEIATKNALLRSEQSKQQLQTDVQQAMANARAAKRSFEAANQSFDAAQAAFQNARIRFDLGTINTLTFATARNALDMAEVEMTLTKYEYLFRLKILDFYLGRELKLD